MYKTGDWLSHSLGARYCRKPSFIWDKKACFCLFFFIDFFLNHNIQQKSKQHIIRRRALELFLS